MRHRIRLPDRLGSSFSLRNATDAGVGRGRANASDLHRPFRGIRSTDEPETFAAKVACHQPRMKPYSRYIGVTAVRIWGLPYPKQWESAEPVHVAVPHDRTPPRTAGVKGRRLATHRAETYTSDGRRVVDPLAAVLSCAESLTVNDAVKLIDALITDSIDYPDLLPGRPVYTIADVEARLQVWHPFPGHQIIRTALARARAGVDSPKETETRLLLVNAGLPEPAIQYVVRERGRVIARTDLAYPELKIAIEYEGDGHRRSKEQWRRDIQRQRDLESRGWIVIRLTQLDLDEDADKLLATVRRAILSRTA